MNTKIHAVIAASLFAASAGWASTDTVQLVAQAAPATAAAVMTAGEVRKVDVEGAKVTIRHEPITNLDMPAMTMVFRASKPEQLKGLKVGDKVRFHAESNAGNYTVTQIEAAK
jgi:Cu(I)/Ag(I) efflux system periplasmic protein CusF